MRRCRSGFFAVLGISFVINILVLTTSVYMLQVYDRVLSARSLPTLVYLTVIAAAALLAMALLEVVRSRLLVRIGAWLERILSPLTFARAVENAVRGASYRGEAVRDIVTVCKFLSGGGMTALFDAPWMPIYLGFVFLLHPLLGLVATFGAVILFLLALVNNLATQKRLKEANMLSGRGQRSIEMSVRNAEVVDGMGMIGALAGRWDANNAKVLALQGIASDRAGIVSATAKFVRMLLQIAILGSGAYLVLENKLTAGSMVAASIIMGRALAPVEQAIGTWKSVLSAREAWRRVNELFATPPLHGSTMPLPKPRGEVAVEHVTYTPAGRSEPVLKDISFHLPHGEALAVIGPSAAGKSTLARILVGILGAESGVARLDGADVHSWSRDDYGRCVGYLPQDVELFPGTIRENIARMDASADPEAVIAAARMAGVHEMILRLPKGYDSEIGEQGAILSGGQRQRVGLARAMFGGPSLLVLDEPNASLDASGEQALNEAISAMKAAGTSVVVIAHRPSLMAQVDKILVLNEGRVEMFGERNAVLSQIQRQAIQRAEPKKVQVVKA
ncbi:MAG: type I secretion system permease/ATPase [Alphaproteobacteria bacterium]|nr:type I secretion system permease/ATPase [Alphaproteobacteria bacterium]